MFLSMNFSQAQSVNDILGGEINLSDGRSTVRISIGNDRFDQRRLIQRVRLLEQAVRDLQDVVYDLQANPAQEIKFNCHAVTCRQSTSIHSANSSTCSMFGMFRPESFHVWASSGSEAEIKADDRLNSDSDVRIIQSPVSCDIAR